MNNNTKTPMSLFTFPQEIFNDYDLKEYSNTYYFKKNEEIPLKLIHFSQISIILEGIIILYWKNENNETTIIDFKNNNQVLRPAVNIMLPDTIIYAKCIQDCKLIVFTRGFLCKASQTSEEISKFYYNLLNEDITATYKQLKVLKESNIKNRYLIFLKQYKHIFNYISDRQVASFLGVHYTTLSRVKSRIFSNK